MTFIHLGTHINNLSLSVSDLSILQSVSQIHNLKPRKVVHQTIFLLLRSLIFSPNLIGYVYL